MIESKEEDTTTNTEKAETHEENDPWANDGSILPDSIMGCHHQYQLLSQPPETYEDDEMSDDAEETNAVSLDIADSLLRGLEEDYRATHARTFAATPPPAPSVMEVKVADEDDNVGEASVEDNEGNHNELSDENNDGNSFFPVHWNDPKPDAEVDMVALRKTIQGISENKTSKFIQKYSAWQQRQQASHPIIPSAPYQAFLRETDKAKRATASLSRSATIAESLWRCQQQNLLKPSENKLIVDVVGVDHVECASIAKIQETFKPVVRWLGAWDSLPTTRLELRLVGRDLSKSVSAEPIDLLSTKIKSSLNKATAICFSEICYHDWRATVERNPDLIIAFNAGIWGYVEWAPTLHALGQGSTPTPTIITSYTLEESQEDHESIEEAVTGTAAKAEWGPEPNPFGSKMIRETKSSSREYRENSAWQMWLLGGTQP